MIPSLDRGRIPKFERPELARQLRLAPWCWPHEGHPRFEFAQNVSALSEPEILPPGVAPGLTVWQDKSVTLWRVEVDAGKIKSHATLGADARRAWEDAGCALPRSVPVLWDSVRAATLRNPVVSRIESLARSGTSILESAIEGPSFGLTFALILASRAFGLRLPIDLAASAELDANGRVKQVEGIDLKVAGLQALAPRITRFLVAEDQRKEADDAAEGGLEVIGVRTLGEALRIVFGSALEEALVKAGADDTTRRELIRSFLRLSLASREAAIDWKPIEQGAIKARAEWKTLDHAERYPLEFAIAVAARHDRNAGGLSAPPEKWLAEQPLPVRIQVAAHLVQQAADVGEPAADIAASWVSRYASCEPREALPHQLGLLGAEARLWAVTGRAQDALDRQEEIARTSWASFDAAQVSYPLSEWFRLSGACGDPESFVRAGEFYSELVRSAGLTGHSSLYVELARSKAGLQLATLPDDELLRVLTTLVNPRVPDHLCWSAHRWLRRLHRTAGRYDDAQKLWANMIASDTSDAKTQRALATLDDPVETAPARENALADLQTVNPGPTNNLLAAARRLGKDPATYVATLFPY